MAGASSIGKGAHRVGRLVLVGSEKIVEPLVANGLHEPFTSHQLVLCPRSGQELGPRTCKGLVNHQAP